GDVIRIPGGFDRPVFVALRGGNKSCPRLPVPANLGWLNVARCQHRWGEDQNFVRKGRVAVRTRPVVLSGSTVDRRVTVAPLLLYGDRRAAIGNGPTDFRRAKCGD